MFRGPTRGVLVFKLALYRQWFGVIEWYHCSLIAWYACCCVGDCSWCECCIIQNDYIYVDPSRVETDATERPLL